MGFGSIAANILLFLGVIVIASSFIFYMNSYASETSSAMTMQKNQMMDEMHSQISILSSDLNTSKDPDELKLYVQNTGSTRLTLSETDVYVDGNRISRSNRSVSVESDTDVGNPELWDPDEIIELIVSRDVDSGVFPVKVASSFGANDQTLVSS
ncbi:MAG: hypothetical protein ACOCZV_01200 [Nanoarchaeota archaeon]